MQKNVASQKFIVFAFNKTNNNPVTGDAANITANIRKDYGSSVATDDVNPTEQEDGYYAFDATQAETNADAIQIFPESSTADVQVILVGGIIYTTPVNFGDDVVQTGDSFTRLGAPAGASVSADIADLPTSSEFDARTLPAADYFDSSTDQVIVATNNDKTGYSIFGTIATLDGLNNFDPATDTVALVTNITNELSVNIAKINGVTITGDGSGTPFDV